MAAIQQPSEVTEAPSNAPAFCSPCHSVKANLMFGVASAHFGLVAVGVEEPAPTQAMIWTSADGLRWSRAGGFASDDGSVALAAAASDQGVVVVGSSDAGAAAWLSTDGVSWISAPRSGALQGPMGGTAMTAVLPWRAGFVAAGHRDDPANGRAVAAIWLSQDRMTWRRVADDPTFDGTRITGLAARGNTIVAVGGTSATASAPSVVWVSHDGERWTRVNSVSLTAGAMRAVTPGGPGFVAVGLASHDGAAAAWTSEDGVHWHRAADTSDFHAYSLPIRMASVTAFEGGLVAVGWKSDAGNGSAVVWTSNDGGSWRRSPDQPSFSGAEMTAVTEADGRLVAVGTGGYPDNDQAQVWLAGR